MWPELYLFLQSLSQSTFLYFALIVIGSYIIQGLVSSAIISAYKKDKVFSDESSLLTSKYLPSIALIAPAYNESAVIVDSVRSLLGNQYFNLEIIVVNDGSTDDTLEKLISSFQLVEHESRPYFDIATKRVKSTYKSANKAFKNLTVIDKENGRKADAINVGINHSWADYYAIIDLDCILEPNALLMLIEPVLKAKEKKVVAVGGVIGATNDSLVKHGKFISAKAPKSFLPRIQIIEYIRAFLFGRPAWNSINGLLIISGALGLFERKVLHAVGGYSHDAIGEDMDLIMKIHKYCLENKIDYQIGYVPYPLCWTEVPETNRILGSQRNRWMRGTIECMWKFRKMLFNPKYGIVGMVSYPYWLVAEMLAPIIEMLGLLIIIVFIYLGVINWVYALLLLILVYLISIAISFYAISLFYLNFKKYRTKEDLLALYKTAALEPLIYHPRVLGWSIRGYWDYFNNKNLGWGEMVRVGFKKNAN